MAKLKHGQDITEYMKSHGAFEGPLFSETNEYSEKLHDTVGSLIDVLIDTESDDEIRNCLIDHVTELINENFFEIFKIPIHYPTVASRFEDGECKYFFYETDNLNCPLEDAASWYAWNDEKKVGTISDHEAFKNYLDGHLEDY